MPPLLNIHDKCQTVLWYLVEAAKQTHEPFTEEEAVLVRQLDRHKTQVQDLIDEIKHTIRKFHKWSAGREILPELIPIVIRLKIYQWKIFVRHEQYHNIVLNKFNESRQEFTEILATLRQFYTG